jgi:hypothetical protein
METPQIEPPKGRSSCPAPVGVGRFVIRATRERGVGVRLVGAWRRQLVKQVKCKSAQDVRYPRQEGGCQQGCVVSRQALCFACGNPALVAALCRPLNVSNGRRSTATDRPSAIQPHRRCPVRPSAAFSAGAWTPVHRRVGQANNHAQLAIRSHLPLFRASARASQAVIPAFRFSTHAKEKKEERVKSRGWAAAVHRTNGRGSPLSTFAAAGC